MTPPPSSAQDLAVLMYHYVRPADRPVRVGAGCVDLDTFAAQLDDLQRHAVVVVLAAGRGRAWRAVRRCHRTRCC